MTQSLKLFEFFHYSLDQRLVFFTTKNKFPAKVMFYKVVAYAFSYISAFYRIQKFFTKTEIDPKYGKFQNVKYANFCILAIKHGA